jgi:hypothetical protein
VAVKELDAALRANPLDGRMRKSLRAVEHHLRSIGARVEGEA